MYYLCFYYNNNAKISLKTESFISIHPKNWPTSSLLLNLQPPRHLRQNKQKIPKRNVRSCRLRNLPITFQRHLLKDLLIQRLGNILIDDGDISYKRFTI